MTKDKSTPLGHAVTHTDTAQGKGGGRLTEDPNPGGALANERGTENAKSRDWKDPSGDLPGTTAQEEADKKGTAGKDMTGKPG